jgi:ketol-acid reductoisomerase
MDAATRHPDADFVMMTGDLVHHQVWNTTIEDNLAHYAAFFDVLNEAFPNISCNWKS